MNLLVPKVSVILPTYNRASLVAQTIESVLKQSFTNLELIVVDDGSSDETPLLLATYSDERLVLLRQENKGRSQARNEAIRRARGAYIAFIDSDDLYLPDKLALQVALLDEHPDIGMVYTSASCIDEEGKDLGISYAVGPSGHIYSSIAFFKPVTITLPTVMVRRDVLDKAGQFDEQMYRFEDTDMWRRISKFSYIHAMDIETCRLRTHKGNALIAQDPRAIMAAISYYRNKVLTEDWDIPRSVRGRGMATLQLYYGAAFLKVAGWRLMALELIAKAHRDSPRVALLWCWSIVIRVLERRLRPGRNAKKILRS